MKVLFLHGLHAEPGGIVPTFLQAQGHEVIEPILLDAGLRMAAISGRS